MKWIDARTESGQSIALSVNSDGILFTRIDGIETALGKPSQFQARMGAKRAYAELNLPDIGVLRTKDVDVIDAWFAHLDLSDERTKKRLSPTSIGLVILASIALAVVLLFSLGLPWLARLAAEHIPLEWEKTLAAGTLSAVSSSFPHAFGGNPVRLLFFSCDLSTVFDGPPTKAFGDDEPH